MTVVDDPRLKDHWYLQSWMTEFRPGEGAEPVQPVPPITRVVRTRPPPPSVLPEPFEPLRQRLVPASPLFDPLGLHPLRIVDHRLQSLERKLAAALLLAALLVYLAINAGFANRRLIRSAHENGKEVYVWTVNDAPTMSAMISRGVDGLLTDKPALARSVLEERAQMSAPERLLLELAGVLGSVAEIVEQ